MLIISDFVADFIVILEPETILRMCYTSESARKVVWCVKISDRSKSYLFFFIRQIENTIISNIIPSSTLSVKLCHSVSFGQK